MRAFERYAVLSPASDTFGSAMRADEFAPIAAAMQARWWAFPIPTAALDQYLVDLRDLDAAKVAAAVDALSADGLRNPPTPGQIRRRIAEIELDTPSWGAARAALVAWRADGPRRAELTASWGCPHGQCDDELPGMIVDVETNTARDCECREEYIATRNGLSMLPALVREFVADGHVSRHEIDLIIRHADSTIEAQVRTRYEQFTRRAVDSRVYAGLPAGDDVPRIEAARREDDARREGGPQRFDARRIVGALERGAA